MDVERERERLFRPSTRKSAQLPAKCSPRRSKIERTVPREARIFPSPHKLCHHPNHKHVSLGDPLLHIESRARMSPKEHVRLQRMQRDRMIHFFVFYSPRESPGAFFWSQIKRSPASIASCSGNCATSVVYPAPPTWG